MKTTSYKWYRYHLLAGCPKCGNKIPFQGIQGYPECDDCGCVLPQKWTETLAFAGVDDLKKKKDNTGTKTLFGAMNVNSTSEAAEGLPCYHCKKNVEIKPGTAVADLTCNHCEKPLPVAQDKNLPELLFYKYGKDAPLGEKTMEMVAVRCASCGAPLQADPSKTNYHCQFCSTENILPPSLRRKVKVDDMYVGVLTRGFDAGYVNKFNSVEELKEALKGKSKNDFEPVQLDDMVRKFPDDFSMLQYITKDFGYKPSRHAYEFLWNKSNSREVLTEVGKYFSKTQDQIKDRIEHGDRGHAKPNANIKPVKVNGTGPVIVLVVVTIVVAVVLWMLFAF